MAIERTLSILKPDATIRDITGAINSMIEKEGIHIIAQKRIHLTIEQAEEFYAEHKGKPFQPKLIECMTAAPVVVQVLQGEDVITHYRKVAGATDPAKAEEGTIRRMYGQELPNNTVHGSDCIESAKREIAFFFTDEELLP